ncbi:hypothetical protein PULV_b0900 [Pseudoalteromonas ulvae UL12]|uniref:DUF3192 domain-containing protein n=1 Tax=Pseudoalteromonas ulvae TaxID=107327 RepID=A0A244CRA2_PSEDV|nr:DUF3192 domain-containing protein [Pseudoalteromonas ulvae]MBE0366153.1 hypothetical protein [Pseudoalteromonas ulvae UL12]OUL58132.1 hypothetical protein B1199_07195 [Pseudoalteromonas ulvae]
MTKKIIRYILLGIGLYVILATLVIVFYQDDPASMNWRDRESFNNRFISKLDLKSATSIDLVFDKLGSPDLTFAKNSQDNTYQIVFYRTQHVKSDGITTQDECTGILFKNGILLAWGLGALATYENGAI